MCSTQGAESPTLQQLQQRLEYPQVGLKGGEQQQSQQLLQQAVEHGIGQAQCQTPWQQ